MVPGSVVALTVTVVPVRVIVSVVGPTEVQSKEALDWVKDSVVPVTVIVVPVNVVAENVIVVGGTVSVVVTTVVVNSAATRGIPTRSAIIAIALAMTSVDLFIYEERLLF